MSLAKKYINSITSDEKVNISVRILLERVFEEGNMAKKKVRTNYRMNKKLR